MEKSDLNRCPIPRSVIRRLPQYLWKVLELSDAGEEWVSSRTLAEALGLTSSTVRQDLSYLEYSGVAKRGYEVHRLEQTIADFLGAHEGLRVALVGLGNLGRALALHQEFARRGFCICALFDHSPAVIGKSVGLMTVRAMDEMAAVIRAERIDVGVIAVPASSAQTVADQLVAAGVRGLLNLAPTAISVSSDIPVTDSRIVASLMELTCEIRLRTQHAMQVKATRYA